MRKIPILIGGGGEKKTLRYTARHADIWHSFGDADVLRHKNTVLDKWCAEIGRDPSEIERSVGANLRSVDRADGLHDAGATLITLSVDGRSDYDLSPVPEWLAWRDAKNNS
jgi:alkanesulfonate monooxygenase SsuD/methylene tetrahydromethanopterin reductase-like flavin-dependent oxidoreductase (luciferase family)